MKSLIKIEENKEVFIINNIYEFIDPEYIYIPITNFNDFVVPKYIYKNTYFTNYIASTSGMPIKYERTLADGREVTSLKVLNDFKENSNTSKKKVNINTKEELLNILKTCHLDNLVNKLSTDKTNLVVTSFDEEIYSMQEFMCLNENYQNILKTMDTLSKILKLESLTLAVKNTNFKSIQNVKSIIGTYPNIKLKLLPDKYLISYPTFLSDFLNIPLYNTIILTTNEMYNLYLALNGKDITEVILTISGDAIVKSLIIKTKIGTCLDELLKKYIDFKTNDYDIYLNGYLNGIKLNNESMIIITKDTKAIILKKREYEKESACIRCGACLKVCPAGINVLKCYLKGKINSKCIKCGLCNYVCPAKIKLKEIVVGDENETNEYKEISSK